MAPIIKENITAYILAGGKSKRMGFDKRLIKLKGQTLLEIIGLIVEEVTGISPIYVGDNLEEIISPEYKILNDHQKDKGPLAGLVSALLDCPTEWALALAGDMPLLSKKCLINLLNAPKNNLDVITLSVSGNPEPFAAIYRADKAEFWLNQLKKNELRIKDGIYQLEWDVLDCSNREVSLMNINTPEDLENIQKYFK